ncbi:MAG TPA: kynureninase [Vicinamibacterales bacterium]|nr:kynureninase [Vicinamibacterales bacterium]
MTRADCAAEDARDPLAPLRAQFALDRIDADRIIYLDGNSLGVLPKAAISRLREVVEMEWGVGLIRSWNSAGWIDLSQRIGDKIGRLIGAGPGEISVADSTSVNLFKALSAGVEMNRGRSRILSERNNFPTDLYIAETFARDRGLELTLVDHDQIISHLDDRTAILLLTHASYRTGRMYDMASVTRAAHDKGVVTIWDLAHTAGSVPVDLNGARADIAVGCGYKYLNGGPGAAAFIWVRPDHVARMDRDRWRQPLSGWLGHAAPFAFSPTYEPAAGMARFICGTPPVLSMAALECGVDSLLAAEPTGGMTAIRAKSIALTDLFMRLVDDRCANHGFTIVTPRDPEQRGSQVSISTNEDGYAIMQALIAKGVIGDFRPPDILRFGFTPLYTRFVDVWDAADRLSAVMTSGEWRDQRFAVRAAVT